MKEIFEKLSETTTITKRELLLTAVASLMTGIVVGMKSERRHRPPMPCPPPPPFHDGPHGHRPPHHCKGPKGCPDESEE